MRRLLEGISKDTLAGGLMLLVGLGAALQGMSYSMGTLAAPGPGLFPAALGVLLMPIGIAIALFGKRAESQAGAARLVLHYRKHRRVHRDRQSRWPRAGQLRGRVYRGTG
jgi:hypothetical protein